MARVTFLFIRNFFIGLKQMFSVEAVGAGSCVN